MNTQLYDKVEEYRTSYYTKKSYRQEAYEEKLKSSCKIVFDLGTITSGENTYLIDVGFITRIHSIGVNNCAIDMSNKLPTDKNEILLIVHNSDYDCRFMLKHLQNIKPIVKSNRVLQI